MDTITNESSNFTFPGYVIESTKPSIVILLKNSSSIIFYTALVIMIFSAFYFPGTSTHVKIASSILFVLGAVLMYGYHKVCKATEKLDREFEEIYCSMLTCYLMKRMQQIINDPMSTYGIVRAFENEHPGIKSGINDSHGLVSVFCCQLRNELENILVSEHSEDKLRLLENIKSIRTPHPSFLDITSNAFLVQSLVRGVFSEFASEKYDSSWIGYYKANKTIKVKLLLISFFDNGPNNEARLVSLEKT